MTGETKLVTSKQDAEDTDKKKPVDTKLPVALPGVSHEHLEDQGGGEAKNEKSERKKTS